MSPGIGGKFLHLSQTTQDDVHSRVQPTIVQVPANYQPGYKYRPVQPTLVQVPSKRIQKKPARVLAAPDYNGFNQVIYKSPHFSYDYKTPSVTSLSRSKSP